MSALWKIPVVMTILLGLLLLVVKTAPPYEPQKKPYTCFNAATCALWMVTP